jgi:hypothetical protein
LFFTGSFPAPVNVILFLPKPTDNFINSLFCSANSL